ncbi:MAG TPA: molecular chaperone HtpG [Streptosporangiaceae bacterium]
MTADASQERHSFQAEVVQLLDLMIHSLYSKKEIFLRELISNASDAIDRLRFEAFSRPEVQDDDAPLRIRVAYDKDARTITISDNGIGMSREEVRDHIGTIAKSGTREFLQALTGDQRKDATLIGQFGVGFYSAFIVADRVTLTTRRAGLPAAEGVRWESDGRGEYSLRTVERPARGTEIELHLRDGEDDLLNGYQLRSIIQKYSDHISLPIVMPDESPGGAGAKDGEGGEDGGDGEEGDGGAPKETVVNRASALWARAKSDIGEADYNEFYKHVSHDFADPLAYVHSKVEGTYEYTLLLYVPAAAPFDLWLPTVHHGVKLHVQRVFIMEDDGQLLPSYLRFVRGVIDSSDLPLNISREILQSSRVVDNIRSTATKRVLRLLGDLAENQPDKYATFWKEFGAVLKEGIAEDYSNRDDIARLLRFTSTKSGGDAADVSLADYVARMKDGQDKIYYLVAPTPAAAKHSPHLEVFRDKDIEVLLLADLVDNWVVTNLHEFDGKRLQSVTQGVSDLGALEDESDKQAKEQAGTELAAVVDRMKKALGDKVRDVRVSGRLTTSPSCIVASEPETEINLARRIRGSGLPSQPVLEINPGHRLVRRLKDEADEARFADWAQVLYSQAVLTLGAQIEDPAGFVTRLNDLLVSLAAKDG